MKTELEIYVEELSYLFNVPAPPIVTSCEKTCPEASKCRFVACYSHRDNALCFRTGYDNPVTALHEYGHWLFHQFYPGRCPGLKQECEEYAMNFQEYMYEVSKLADTHHLWRCPLCGEIVLSPLGDLTCPGCGEVFQPGEGLAVYVNEQRIHHGDVGRVLAFLGGILAFIGSILMFHDWLLEKGLK